MDPVVQAKKEGWEKPSPPGEKIDVQTFLRLLGSSPQLHLCPSMAHPAHKLPQGTFSSLSSGAEDVHPPGLGWDITAPP